MEWNTESTIGQIVAQNSRTATIFSKYKIDFCCQGHRTLGEASEASGMDPLALIKELENIPREGQAPLDVQGWPLDLIADYIEKKHHRYVRTEGPVVEGYLNKIRKVHGRQHPELEEIYSLFVDSLEELHAHMIKEEKVLFPYIRQMVEAHQRGAETPPAPFGQMENPIQAMMAEHDVEGERFRKIESLSNNYQVPPDGCMTYRLAFRSLKQFEEDLHWHIHVENNILFPQAIELEKAGQS